MKLSENVQVKDLRHLAAATILQAMEDAKRSDVVLQLDAALWLTGEDIGFWCEWAGMPFANLWQALTSGKIRALVQRRKFVRNIADSTGEK